MTEALCNKQIALPRLRILKLRISTKWKRPEKIPGVVIANVLRGAVGYTFRKLVCPAEWFHHDCHPCPLYSQCEYGRIFFPKPSEIGNSRLKQQDAPRPFVIEPPDLADQKSLDDKGIEFGVKLFGNAIDSLPLFVTTLERLGQDGMGKNRTPFEILEVVSLHNDRIELVCESGSNEMRVPSSIYTEEDFHIPLDWPNNDAANRRVLDVHFDSPLLLMYGSQRLANGKTIPAKEVRESPPFDILLGRLRDRLSALSLFYGDEWKVDFRELGDMAKSVETVESNTVWLTRNRRSTRTGQHQEISGLIGWSRYQFPSDDVFKALLPLLRVGELIHVGKNTTWGNGAIRLSLDASDRNAKSIKGECNE